MGRPIGSAMRTGQGWSSDGWEAVCVNGSKTTCRPLDKRRKDPGAEEGGPGLGCQAGLGAGGGTSPWDDGRQYLGQCGVGFSLLNMCWTQGGYDCEGHRGSAARPPHSGHFGLIFPGLRQLVGFNKHISGAPALLGPVLSTGTWWGPVTWAYHMEPYMSSLTV